MPPKPGCCRDWRNPNQPVATKKWDEREATVEKTL